MKFFATKVQKLSQKITPFAGISYVNSEFNNCGLSQLIDTELGTRGVKAEYSYSDIFRSWFNLFLCGGECAEDIQVHLRNSLEQIPHNPVPSADTLLRGIKELAQENTKVVSTSGKVYNFNINNNMNELNIKLLLLTKQLESGKSYDLDYDNQIIAHEKYDAKATYKKNTGYFPGISNIGSKIIFIENRDGNANVKTGQAETLERVFNLLNTNDITIYRSRYDAGSYSKEIINVISKNSKLFYIRANKCETLAEQIRSIDSSLWEEVEINFKKYQVTTIKFTSFYEERGYRLVVMREQSKDTQLDLFTGDNFIYRCILTNDWESTEKAVIEYYNQRGSSEKLFDIQNNDFGWKHLPCSDMHHNTVYLILTAMLKNFYNYIVEKVSKVFTDILPTSRLKRFIFRFISVAGYWVRSGRRRTLKLFTDRPYEKLFAA
jgi:hypothetical protein